MERMICHAERADGTYCDGVAAVTAARFVYKYELIDGQDEQILNEVDYAIDCPKCGKRTIIDRADSHELPTAEIQAAREQFASRMPADDSRLMRSSGEGAFFVQMDASRTGADAQSAK